MPRVKWLEVAEDSRWIGDQSSACPVVSSLTGKINPKKIRSISDGLVKPVECALLVNNGTLESLSVV